MLISLVSAQPLPGDSVSSSLPSSEPSTTSALTSDFQSTAVVTSASSTSAATVTSAATNPSQATGFGVPTNSPMPATATLPVSPSPTAPNRVPPNSSDPSNSSTAPAVAGVISVIIILLIGATVALFLLILFMKRRGTGKEQTSGNLEQQQPRDGFFDNPVYEHLQRKISHKDSHGCSSVYDPICLDIPAGNFGSARGSRVTTGDGDSGYAEPGAKNIPPSRSRSATPVPSSPFRMSSSPVPVPAHDYHTLEPCQLPEDYIEPQPSSSRASGNSERTAPTQSTTCRLDIYSTLSHQAVDHEYHELDPTSGVRPIHSVYMSACTSV